MRLFSEKTFSRKRSAPIKDEFDTINQLLDITKVGINFDSTQGTIEDWVIEA